MSTNIKYIAVARTTDHAVLCEVTFAKGAEAAEYSASVRQVIQGSSCVLFEDTPKVIKFLLSTLIYFIEFYLIICNNVISLFNCIFIFEL